MSQPNIEQASVPAVVTGGDFGSIVANTADESLGFYGGAGQTQSATIAALTTAQTTADIRTTLNSVTALLRSLGLVAAS